MCTLLALLLLQAVQVKKATKPIQIRDNLLFHLLLPVLVALKRSKTIFYLGEPKTLMIGNKIPRASSKRNVGALSKVLNSKRVTNSFLETGKTKGQGAITSTTITLNLWVSL